MLFWLTINETVGERGLLPFFDEKESLECFCPVVSHIYVEESKVRIVYITKYTETVRITGINAIFESFSCTKVFLEIYI